MSSVTTLNAPSKQRSKQPHIRGLFFLECFLDSEDYSNELKIKIKKGIFFVMSISPLCNGKSYFGITSWKDG